MSNPQLLETSRESDYVAALAELAVTFGANLQAGQILAVSSEPGKEQLARAIAEAAYRRGALYVDLNVFDMHFKRARAQHADRDTLKYVPPWLGERALALGEHRCARVALTGPVEPQLMDGVDPTLIGLDMLPALAESMQVVEAMTTNWTAIPCPTPGWAGLVYPQLETDEAFARLWNDIAYICRLDEADPSGAWEQRLAKLTAVSQRLDELRLDALRFDGPGTELTVGLLRSARWSAARFKTIDGIVHAPNIPTEEVFTTPDPQRVDGVVNATKPLVTGGATITGLEVEFHKGRAIRFDADEGAEVLRELSEHDAGATRLGEVALVDREGRIGPLDTVFYDTLIDENAASHIAIGQSYEMVVQDPDDLARVNHSGIHIDFMIGGDEVAVTGLRDDGSEIPLLRGGGWQV